MRFANPEGMRSTLPQRDLIERRQEARGIGVRQKKAREREAYRVAEGGAFSNSLRGFPNCAAVILGVENMPDARVRLVHFPMVPTRDSLCIVEQITIECFLEILTRSVDQNLLSVHLDPESETDSQVLEHIAWVSSAPLPAVEARGFDANSGDVFLMVRLDERSPPERPAYFYSLCHVLVQ